MEVEGIEREVFRARLVEACGGCVAQHDGWPCGTCFHWPGLTWRAVLAFRGDYEGCRTETGYRMASNIVYNPPGVFSHHEFEEYPLVALESEIRQLWEQIQ